MLNTNLEVVVILGGPKLKQRASLSGGTDKHSTQYAKLVHFLATQKCKQN